MDFTRVFTNRVIKSLIIFYLFLFISCAEIAPPPGGEIDKNAPYLIGSVPANGAVNVEMDNSIILYFSERIIKPPTQKTVFISPRPKSEPEIKWKTDQIIVTLPDSFKTNQTYIISVSSVIKDARNNSLDSSTIVAFSTGAIIDSGQISGYTYREDTPQSGMLVALYNPLLFKDTLPIDSLYPDYITQSNKDGFFSFQYLPEKEYKLIAFIDQNQNELFNPNRELFALPDRPVNIVDELPLDNLILPVTTQDTIQVEILSVAMSPDKLVRIRLSKETELEFLKQNLSNSFIQSLEDTTIVLPAYSIIESYQAAAESFHLYFGDIEPGSYKLYLTYDNIKPALLFDTFTVKAKDDINPPGINEFYPDRQPRFVNQIEIEAYFSEPIDTTQITDETFILWDRDNNRIPLAYQWLNPFHVQFNTESYISGMNYHLHITEFEIIDYAGNEMGDSLKEYKINLLNNDSLGSISGEIKVSLESKSNKPAVLDFLKTENNQFFRLPVSGKNFKISLPAGKYILSGFIDSDNNGERGLGSLFPYKYSETTATFPDTISVRARFETAEILFEFK